ncbi:MAG: FISUMP domain-containing protein [Bacteroidota bacterium]
MKNNILLLLFAFTGFLSVQGQPRVTDSVADIDGNVYPTVTIGRQEWMGENLRTTAYRNGTKIPMIPGSPDWTEDTLGAFCWYNNDQNNAKTCGALYNWHAVNTGLLCPDGWKVPSDGDWKLLEGTVDSQYGEGDPVWNTTGGRGNDAGPRLKKSSGWSSGGNGRDDFGFAALPCGERCSYGRFFLAGRSAFWWSSSPSGESAAWYRNMIYSLDDVLRNTHPLWMGFSVRCMREKQKP